MEIFKEIVGQVGAQEAPPHGVIVRGSLPVPEVDAMYTTTLSDTISDWGD